MFKENRSHLEPSLFGIGNQLPPAKAKKLRDSWAGGFYDLVFSNIDEAPFGVLFSEGNGRPNAAVNCLVGATVLMNYRDWPCEQLFEHIDFDLLTRTALGLDGLEQTPFCPATFFNFRNRLLSHYTETGENLLEPVFDSLTAKQLKELGIKADIQRTDSFQAMSNIARYSRVQLLVEMLIRVHRTLPEEDRERFSDILAPYVGQTSGQYLYGLERSAIPHELDVLGKVYHSLYEGLKDTCGDLTVFQTFERVYNEHFTVVADKVEVKLSEELGSGILQSPDDLDATFRKKRGDQYRGQVINVAETANPENPLNLLTDVAGAANNTDDSVILNGRIEPMKEKAPELNELHTDGAYGSTDNDAKMEELGVTHVTTAVRGRTPKVEMQIDETGEDTYEVRCPHQTVTSEPTRKQHKACFDPNICADCTLAEHCPAVPRKKGGRVYYFDREACLVNMRNRNLKTLPPERQKLRANVEATVKEFSKAFNHKGKLKVRGAFATMICAFAMAVGINFGRIHRYRTEQDRQARASEPRQQAANAGNGPAQETKAISEEPTAEEYLPSSRTEAGESDMPPETAANAVNTDAGSEAIAVLPVSTHAPSHSPPITGDPRKEFRGFLRVLAPPVREAA